MRPGESQAHHTTGEGNCVLHLPLPVSRFSLPGPDQAASIRIGGRGNSLDAARERALIGGVTGMGDPAFKVEGDGAIDRHPLTIVFAGNVNVRTCGRAALAGGETQWVTTF